MVTAIFVLHFNSPANRHSKFPCWSTKTTHATLTNVATYIASYNYNKELLLQTKVQSTDKESHVEMFCLEVEMLD